MKKILCTMLSLIMLAPATSFASYESNHTAHTSPPYHAYYNGDTNWPIIWGHQGYAGYMDRSSVVILKDDEQGIKFAYRAIGINFNHQPPEVRGYGTTWFYKPWSEPDIAYVKYKENGQWYRFRISDKYGYNRSRRQGFLLGWEIAKGSEYHVGVTQAQ